MKALLGIYQIALKHISPLSNGPAIGAGLGVIMTWFCPNILPKDLQSIEIIAGGMVIGFAIEKSVLLLKTVIQWRNRKKYIRINGINIHLTNKEDDLIRNRFINEKYGIVEKDLNTEETPPQKDSKLIVIKSISDTKSEQSISESN